MQEAEVLVEKKGRKIFRVILKTLKIFAITCVSLVLLLLLLTYIFEDKIKQYAVDRLNQNLKTPVKVEAINFSFFTKFPNASLEFSKVFIEDPDSIGRKKDTLLYADKIFLEFNIWDVFSGNYQVKKVETRNAYVNLFVDHHGRENYDVWKKSSDTTESKFDFNLRKIRFNDTRFRYDNRKSKQDFAFTFHDLDMSGRFTESEFDLGVKTNCRIHSINNRHYSLLNNKNSIAEFDLHINKNTSTYSFKKGNLKIGDLGFSVLGSLNEVQDGTNIDLVINGNNISIESLLLTFPWMLNDDVAAYNSKGQLEFTSTIKGISGANSKPEINAQFNIADGSLSEKKSGVTLSKLNFKGSYQNRNEKGEEQLELKNVSGIFSEGTFGGEVVVINLDKPHVRGSLHGNFRLESLQKFFRFKNVEESSGGIKLSAQLDADFNYDESASSWNMKIRKSSGTAELNSINLRMTDHHVPYLGFTGIITLQNDHATVDDLKGMLGKTDVRLSGILNNLVPYLLLENKKLNIVADFYSQKADLDDLFGGGTKTDTATTRLRFPADINFNLDTRIDEIVFEKFNAKKITGNFKLIDQQFTATNLGMRFAGGTCSASLEIDGRNEDLFGITSKVKIEEMQIRDLFIAFENFGQNEILPENIKGSISSEILFGAVMDSRLLIDKDKIVAQASLLIKNGELIELKTLKGIADFLRKDKVMRMALRKHIDDLERRLLHVKFAELTNDITIRNGKVIIPRMNISSSALDLKMSGIHQFNDSIDYAFDFRFRDLKMDQSETEYGTIIDDGTGIRVYIEMTGTIDNPVYKSNPEQRKEDRKEYNRNEISNAKAILQQEFGLFKKDTTLKIKETPKEEIKFLYEWDEEKKEEKKSPENNTKSPDNKKRMDKLKNKLGIEEEEKKGFEVEG